MKLLLNLLLVFIAFALVRRALRGFFARPTPPEPPRRSPESEREPGSKSGTHPAFPENKIIEDAEFEELE